MVRKQGAIASVGVLAVGVLLAGCASQSPAAGSNTDTQSESSSNSEQSQQSSGDNLSNDVKFPQAGVDTGVYADGTYSVSGSYGEYGSSTMDVSITLGDGTINDVTVKPTNTSAISQRYSKAFMKQIDGQVVGKQLKDLKLDTVAGASWTTEAFNTALNNIRGDASAAAAQ
ncbi:FMN-binding protein [Alloscardovia omnicolens]|uniref:FMN-binding protein n=1 Tax=Alloscardovia omnicolens TaxID=419015 RepID=UPI003A67067C